MRLIDLALNEAAIVMPEKELRQIIIDSERYEALFYSLFETCLISLVITRNPLIEKWIHEHYLELRPELTPQLKQMYLKNVAFRIRGES